MRFRVDRFPTRYGNLEMKVNKLMCLKPIQKKN
jgi:hypothetical protein